MLEVVGLYCYPIKSCGRVTLTKCDITPMGLVGDRQWMLVDDQGVFLSQRTLPIMGLIDISLNQSNHHLTLNAPDMPTLTVTPEQTTGYMSVIVWKDHVKAEVAETHINDWFSEYLNQPCRLVRFGQTSQRLVDPEFTNGNKQVAFADGFPLLVTHMSTLEQLNQQLQAQNHPHVTMQRFRPNIVVKSDLKPQDEYRWDSIYNQQFKIDLVKPCSRCLVTNLDPKTASKTGNTVLSTLAQRHRLNNKAIFGINGISNQSGAITLGDQLEIHYQNTTEDQLTSK